MGIFLICTGLLLVVLSVVVLWRLLLSRATDWKIVAVTMLAVVGVFILLAGIMKKEEENAATRKTQAERAATEETTFDEKTAAQ